MASLVIPADYCVALIDAQAYASFLDPQWTLEGICGHFVAAMNDATMLAWGTGASGNWHVEVVDRDVPTEGFREFTGRIRASGTQLHVTNYESLTMAAQFDDVRLPEPGTEHWSIAVAPGEYDCRIVQLFDPGLAESTEVFEQATPHFRLTLVRAEGPAATTFERVPWFVEAEADP